MRGADDARGEADKRLEVDRGDSTTARRGVCRRATRYGCVREHHGTRWSSGAEMDETDLNHSEV